MDRLSKSQLEQWMSFYYQNPQPDRLPDAIATLSQEGYLQKANAVQPILFFLSCIFRDRPEKLSEWLSQWNDLPSRDRQILVNAIWLSNTPQAREYLANLAKETEDLAIENTINSLIQKSPPDIASLPIGDPSMIDVFWAGFMATGEEKYVLNIIAVLSNINSSEDSLKTAIANAAKWSLTSQARIHEKVMLICLGQLEQQSEEIGAILQGIVTDARTSSR
ncbi:MAG: hypothetical protein AAGA60_13000 [Cyanobacteria bacterium P01_E01_bin.42]